MKLLPFPLKSKEVCDISQFGYLTVLEGSVRSGKTIVSLVAWLLYVIRSPEKVFLMSGYTAGSLLHNCITEEAGLKQLSGNCLTFCTDENGRKYLNLAGKHIYYCGAGNADSHKVITGLTIGGWYADEVNKQHPTFVNQAFNRSIASADRCNFWTLNPEAPAHWIYKDYIDKYKKDGMPDYRWFHYTLDDNPKITPERKEELKRQYTGVYYRRDILGQRIKAEGPCYPSFVHNEIGEEGNILYDWPKDTNGKPRKILWANIGADIGGNGSATTNACTVFFENDDGDICMVLMDEYYDAENTSTESIISAFAEFAKRNVRRYPVNGARSDSAEQLIKKSYNALGIVTVANSLKRPIKDRIRFWDLGYNLRRIFIWHTCRYTIDAVESAVWDSKAKPGHETRLDDGTSNIDSLDAWEYSAEEYMPDFNMIELQEQEEQ